jgi:hypothetical protein
MNSTPGRFYRRGFEFAGGRKMKWQPTIAGASVKEER